MLVIVQALPLLFSDCRVRGQEKFFNRIYGMMSQKAQNEEKEVKRDKLYARISFWGSALLATLIMVLYYEGTPPDTEEVKKMRRFFKDNVMTVTKFIKMKPEEMDAFAARERHPFYKTYVKSSVVEQGQINALIHVSIDYNPNQYWFNIIFGWAIFFTPFRSLAMKTVGKILEVFHQGPNYFVRQDRSPSRHSRPRNAFLDGFEKVCVKREGVCLGRAEFENARSQIPGQRKQILGSDAVAPALRPMAVDTKLAVIGLAGPDGISLFTGHLGPCSARFRVFDHALNASGFRRRGRVRFKQEENHKTRTQERQSEKTRDIIKNFYQLDHRKTVPLKT